jgi:hypothetical protein
MKGHVETAGMVLVIESAHIPRLAEMGLLRVREWKWINAAEAMRLLDCSPGTLKKLRDTGAIEYSVGDHGRKIMYDKNSLDQYLEERRMRKF